MWERDKTVIRKRWKNFFLLETLNVVTSESTDLSKHKSLLKHQPKNNGICLRVNVTALRFLASRVNNWHKSCKASGMFKLTGIEESSHQRPADASDRAARAEKQQQKIKLLENWLTCIQHCPQPTLEYLAVPNVLPLLWQVGWNIKLLLR